ncbi:hypothetical protein Vadar_009472 [Vaccinium darrowii]|uniref:Uncharacterized protein n=1 Tax=Vaccinium darrowii TaxID=229202 RepID=A0ACB7Y5X6_9ERIC|nr:hypothetical protein Vadar_009472 [Vaccinium darrowii]
MAKSLSSFTASSGSCDGPGNHMGSTQGGELFRRKTPQDIETREVVVKIWASPSDLRKYPRFSGPVPDLRQSRSKAEIKLLTDSVMCGHPNMVKLNGYCLENGQFGVVYDLEPLDTAPLSSTSRRSGHSQKTLGITLPREGMGSPSELVEYTYETLDSITGGLSPGNHMGSTQSGELFRGKIPQDIETREVVVKIWASPSDLRKYPRFSGPVPDLRQSRSKAEIKLLTDSVMCGHPNMVKLNGYCFENGQFGVVYDLEPLDTVHKLVLQGDLIF